ncbi:hypothetical protein BT96DRAFT_1024526 [Gymnopus androsaceus JB14]|uniref:DUF7918 domain-containing protein n=1 Tax=Gymnopus androsaceus JB14 TaxID=1447944 RepID=A0A6A4GZF1_9AGAR|nr:hypothetical protein BT96DRAFT_1024526 [Gymnopus androsaceus JB14]
MHVTHISHLGSLHAWVSVDDERLPEFQITTARNKQQHVEVTCWIPSTPEKEFKVHWSTNKRKHALTGDVYLDGSFGGGKVMDVAGQTLFKKDSYQRTLNEIQPYVFSRLQLTDDDECLQDLPSQLGEIKLVITRCKILGQSNVQGLTTFNSSDRPVHERSKKAFSHKIKLGDVKQCELQVFTDVVREEKVATICFRYRPLDRLQADGIAPANSATDPSGTLSGKKRIRELEMEVARLSKLVRRKVSHIPSDSVKSEPDSSSDLLSTQIKSEPGSSTTTSLLQTSQNDVVDLTLDDD